MTPARPDEIRKIGDQGLKIKWSDKTESNWTARELRIACPCAGCRDELSGRRTLNPETIHEDIRIVKMDLVGHYALGIGFSDGHASGIYSFDTLKSAGMNRPSS